MSDGAGTSAVLRGGTLWALVGAQVGLHASMAGLRMAAPLQTLREGHATVWVGVLLALFAAAPVALALTAGRMADRFGYHRPARLAAAMTALGALLAVVSTVVPIEARFAVLCTAACLSGAGANIGMITLQRSVGQHAHDGVERVRLFSWVGIAPSLANVVGPVSAGFAIDAAGFTAAYAMLLALPLFSLVCIARVPASASSAVPPTAGRTVPTSRDLLAAPGMKRLLGVNWLMSSCWDVHSFAVPVLGHQFDFDASTVGLILGLFTLSVSAVRLLLPLVAHRVREAAVVRASMIGTALVFALYPLASSPWSMGACALMLGLTLGIVQPMIMSTLHRITPAHRHGEAIALRSMAINAAGTAMPLLFGWVGGAVGAGVLFWLMGAVLVAFSGSARRLGASGGGT